MEHKALPQRVTRRLMVAAIVAAGLAATACEPRPGDPKPPKDPGRSVPKPITADTAPSAAGMLALLTAR
ncbi:MAG TPA: hypothetical protein VEZ89_01490 [Rubrivivax sp.]|nr:hypothetical protein [Rubrivivax sp.]